MAARPPLAARLCGAAAVLVLAGTFLATQIDFVRRHTMGMPRMSPQRYWLPQLTHIWLPGLGASLLCAALAFWLHRRGRPD